jgi:hypothetical protein
MISRCLMPCVSKPIFRLQARAAAGDEGIMS